MFHSFRFLRSQLMLTSFADVGAQLLGDLTMTPLREPRERAEALSRTCRSVCKMHGLRSSVSGALPQGPVIYVCNHLGYVDPLVVCDFAPCSPIAKAELDQWPVLGSVARRMNVIFVRRGDPYSEMRALLTARRRLIDGVSVLNFPEGTTTRGEMLPFRRGVFGLARLVGVPVVPLAMSFDDPDLCWVDDASLLGHYSSAMVGRQHGVHVAVGPPHHIRESESPGDFAARVREWIVRELTPRRAARQLASASLRSAATA